MTETARPTNLLARLARKIVRTLMRLAELEPTPDLGTAPRPPFVGLARRRYAEEFLRDIPSPLNEAQAAPTKNELATAEAVRHKFLFHDQGDHSPYMADIIRATRLLRGASVYIEVGTFDKGNLAYVSEQLAHDATIIDVDIEPHRSQSERLQAHLAPKQSLHTVVGDSSADETLSRVREILDGRSADAVFIDADHSAHSVFADYTAYAPLVREGGLILFHDVYWHGDEQTFGSAAAIEQVDRFTPVYVIFADHPIHRFLPWLGKQDVIWGGVGIVRR